MGQHRCIDHEQHHTRGLTPRELRSVDYYSWFSDHEVAVTQQTRDLLPEIMKPRTSLEIVEVA